MNINGPRIYHKLAEYFVEEGVDTYFGLMGDGNMHWMIALGEKPGVTGIAVRHEHCALGMAMGYHSATGKVGIASVTCGPGYTQIMTALATAVQADIPMVVFAGEPPLDVAWYNQGGVDQAGLARACGADYIAVHAPGQIANKTREAFYRARARRQPVVLAFPYDMQKQPAPPLPPYLASDRLVRSPMPRAPEPGQVAELAEALAHAHAPVIIGGRGVIEAGAEDEVIALADKCGAVLATTLLGKGLFEAHPFCVGISGGYCSRVTADVGRQADLVVGIGASLSSYTLSGGTLYPNARVVQVDKVPGGLKDGRNAADLCIEADARLACVAVRDALEHLPTRASVRKPELERRIRTEAADDTHFEITDDGVDPRAFFAALERVLPPDYDLVSGSAHQAYWHTTMRGRAPGRYHAARAFGAVGNGISYAAGVAAARQGRVALFEGDGGLMMHLQELETLKRHGLKLLIVCCNDGGYGAETHRLRAEGIDPSSGEFGRPDFAAIARSMGLRGRTVTQFDAIGDWLAEYERGTDAEVWDVHVSAQVMSPRMQMEVAELLAVR